MTYAIPGPDELLRGDAALPPGGLRVIDFWRWAIADLCEDSVKGYFAEWMVAVLLGLPVTTGRRIAHATCDIIASNDVRIEVKATSYWQSWRVFDARGRLRDAPSPGRKISFRVAPTRNSVGLNNSSEPTYQADYYVFCFEHEQTLEHWNPLDLAQWEFYYLTQRELRDLRRTTIPIHLLRNLFMEKHGLPEGLTARQFQERFPPLCLSNGAG